MSRATLISGPTALKFTAGGRKQVKNSATSGQNTWNPQDVGVETRKPPRKGRVETLFYVAIDVSIDKNDQELRKDMFFTAAEVW